MIELLQMENERTDTLGKHRKMNTSKNNYLKMIAEEKCLIL